jgi:hypothetical protein
MKHPLRMMLVAATAIFCTMASVATAEETPPALDAWSDSLMLEAIRHDFEMRQHLIDTKHDLARFEKLNREYNLMKKQTEAALKANDTLDKETEIMLAESSKNVEAAFDACNLLSEAQRGPCISGILTSFLSMK